MSGLQRLISGLLAAIAVLFLILYLFGEATRDEVVLMLALSIWSFVMDLWMGDS